MDQSPGEQRAPDQLGCCRNHGQYPRSDERFHHNDHQQNLGFRQIVRAGDAFERFNRRQNGAVESDFRERRIKNNRLRRDFAQWNQWRRLFSEQNQWRIGHLGAVADCLKTRPVERAHPTFVEVLTCSADCQSAVSPVGNRRGDGGVEWLDCLRIVNPRYSRLPVGATGKCQGLAPKGHGFGRKRFFALPCENRVAARREPRPTVRPWLKTGMTMQMFGSPGISIAQVHEVTTLPRAVGQLQFLDFSRRCGVDFRNHFHRALKLFFQRGNDSRRVRCAGKFYFDGIGQVIFVPRDDGVTGNFRGGVENRFQHRRGKPSCP